MQCPECGGRGRVTSTFNHGLVVQRYRCCPICNHRWKSWEEKDPAKVRAKKSNKLSEHDLFSQAKRGTGS